MNEPESPAIPIFTGSVWTTLDVVGFHNWPDAPASVHHLRDRHRHLFKIKVELGVTHAERAIEFQLLRADLEGWFIAQFGDHILGCEFNDRSCEAIAQSVIGWLQDFYPSAYPYEVIVSEDGESGATLRVELT